MIGEGAGIAVWVAFGIAVLFVIGATVCHYAFGTPNPWAS